MEPLLLKLTADPVTIVEVDVPASLVRETELIEQQFVAASSTSLNLSWSGGEGVQHREVVLLALFLEYAGGQNVSVARALFEAFRKKYCLAQDVHVFVDDLGLDTEYAYIVLRAFYKTQDIYQLAGGDLGTRPLQTALFGTPSHRLLAMFGGQGGVDNYIEETRSVYNTYRPLVAKFVFRMCEFLKQEAAEPLFERLYHSGLDVMAWLEHPESVPEQEYMVTVPVSIPVVGLTQLMQVVVLYRTLGMTPAELASSFEEIAGHSQGIAAATALSMATDEESFFAVCKSILGLLMLTGVYPQFDYPVVTTTSARSTLTEASGATPTSMVFVAKLSRLQIEEAILKYNMRHQSSASMVHLSLTNGARSFVVSGAKASIEAFVSLLYKEHDAKVADQTRIIHSQRRTGVAVKYLSINAPYHCSLLTHAFEGAYEYAASKGWVLEASAMRRAVRAGDDGHDIRCEGNISRYLLQSMFVLPVNWPAAVRCVGITHVVDFGPGGISGFGVLTQRILDGQGVSVICAGAVGRQGSPLATKADLYQSLASKLRSAVNWGQQFRPQLVRCAGDGSIHISTRMSRLLGKPPVMVAGMTPSTISEVFVSAVMRAGYHIELSGGGHFSEPMLRDKVDKILKLAGCGHNITVNSIYVNPFLWNIQYPAILAMRREGIPMEGLCIGAGVPSFEVCNEIIVSIRAVGFRHIGLKPSSVATIRLVIKIAQANPDFPILLQWTGGRAGGHHSYEDFHHPILDTYGAIRAQKNIVLVAGSGFGGVDDTLPFLTGEWSRRFDCAPMPFDGCLFGSRVMVAKEGAASDAVKEAIVAAPGIDDSEWERTYSGPAGGIVTVLSELGEPIHKIATRGVMFWKEMDDTIFSLAREKRLPALMAKKSYIIKRLNDDFQKPWFGKKADGNVADLEEMTYAEVANRLLEVLYIRHQSRWIDITMRNLVGDYLLRLEGRFATSKRAALLQSFNQINDPFAPVKSILDAYPECYTQLLTTEDVQFFINLCMRPGQKPVPFIPLMDKDFHIWFKKDSLWQSEDLDAVPGQDVGRVCILQGPVAVRYATKANEPVRDILDGIYHGQIAALLEQYYGGDESKVPVVGYLGNVPALRAIPAHVRVEHTESERVYMLPKAKAQLPETDAWLETLAGTESNWLRALLITPIVVQQHKYTSSVVRRVLRPHTGQVVRVSLKEGRPQSVEIIDAAGHKALDFAVEADGTIRFNMYSSPRGSVCTLELVFRYQAQMPYAPIHEVMEGRNERIKRFYAQVWFEDSSEGLKLIDSQGDGMVHHDLGHTVHQAGVEEFCYAIGNNSDKYIATVDGPSAVVPLDYAMRAFWPSLCKCLITQTCNGDLTSLVHMSNEFRVLPGAPQMRAGQQLSSEAWISEVLDGDAGRTVIVSGHVISNGLPAVEINTSFLFRKARPDYKRNFRHVHEPTLLLTIKDKRTLALIRSKEWLVPMAGESTVFSLGATLKFSLSSRYRFRAAGVYAYVATFGTVFAQTQRCLWTKVASVDYESSAAYGNPVLRFLLCHGYTESSSLLFESGSILLAEGMAVVPLSSQAYSNASGDHNPIHTNSYFADMAGLPGPIAHGMWTSAAARRCMEHIAAQGCPERVSSYSARFLDMVYPGERLVAQVSHVGMKNGQKLIHIEAHNQAGDKVLEGSAEVDQPPTAFAFTGQGAHGPGMGMELYSRSAVARGVWDSADSFMRTTYGIPLLDIVRYNPTTYTVHFAGRRGAAVRATYRAMAYEYSEHDGSRLISRPLFPDIDNNTESFTFHAPLGLLYATQFTQAAMLVCEVAEFAHLESHSIVPAHAVYAGHSLGEYAGLTAIGRVLTPESAADIGFCRGLTMQQSVRRDLDNRSIYAMVAVSPARVAAWFTPEHLATVVAAVRLHGDYDGLLEIVNYNVRDTQYVVAGELVLLDALAHLLPHVSETAITDASLAPLAVDAVRDARLRKDRDAHTFELHRTHATIPLLGIDVPFHSSLLYDGVWSFRKMLQSKIKPEHVDVTRLRHRYIPNLTASAFDTTREYIQRVQRQTGSPPLTQLLHAYNEHRLATDSAYEQQVAYVLLIEVLSYQFSSPVRWIETQDVLLQQVKISRFVEVGPGNVLSNMLRRTLDTRAYTETGLADSLGSSLEILAASSDLDRILFQGHPVTVPEPEQPSQGESTPAPAAEIPATAVPAIENTAVSLTCIVKDQPIQPLEVVRTLIAHKLKCSLESISADKPIKDFVGGKSTLQNEIIGDLQKEFADDLPEKPEEVPLAELSQSLLPLTQALGRHSMSLIGRMVNSKMPGGFTKEAICHHLQQAYGLGPLRQLGLLLVSLVMEPSTRLDSEASAKAWLATVAHEYAKLSGIRYPSVSQAAGQSRAAGGGATVAVASSKEFGDAQRAHYRLARQTMLALANYLGVAVDPSDLGASDEASPATELDKMAAESGVWSAEYGPSFYEGIKPAFSPHMVRRYDSFWNWARQDLMELYFDIIQGKITKVDLALAPHCLRLVNRFTPSVIDALKYVVQSAREGASPGHMLAHKYGSSLVQRSCQGSWVQPVFQFTQSLMVPRIQIEGTGDIRYAEVARPDERVIRDYVDAVTGKSGLDRPPPRRAVNDVLDTVLQKLGLVGPGSVKRSVHSLPPMVHVRSKMADPTAWRFDPAKSATFANALYDICDNGLSLANKKALITGCGQGSIGAEVLRGLLEGGASVVVTTSSYSLKTTRFFQEIYRRHGSRGSSLVVLPFNQASRQDVDALIEYIYGDSSKGKGLNWDLDYVLPFAAIPELGRDITDLDAQSELAHRAMLTNVFRLLGAIARHKTQRRLDMHPTLAVLPLSPNHGAFGLDGHYSESKIGLETLLDRWHSEPAWQPYISIAGAVIGWTRGTGLMSANNIVAECVERIGVRTFSAGEMAFNILGLLHPKIYALAALNPVWADLAGRFQYYPEVTRSIGELRRALADMEDIIKAVAADSLADFGVVADEETERVYSLRKTSALSNHRFKFPATKPYSQLQHLRHLEGMVNLDKVVVVTGFGEVGPHGNASTRWEMEAYGEYSLEGCIELAWIMGLIKHFNGKSKATGKTYVGWVDAKTEEPVKDNSIKARYEKQILAHTGIRLIEPELVGGYDPNKKHMMRELQIEHDMEPFETTAEEAAEFKLRNGERVRIWANEGGGSSWSVRFLKGATLMVPKALRFDRLAAAQLPTGWDPVRYGIPKDIADQVDPVTCYALVATVEALVRSGITDPYELYKYVHVSEVGSSTGSGLGGIKSTRKVFAERPCDVSQTPDVYQETFFSTPPAWINMLLMSSSGPIKTTVGACATGVASIDVAVDTIQAGKAKVMLAGGTDGFGEESSYEFAQMNATSSSASEQRSGRPTAEMSRPCTSTRSGFVESEGAGIAVLMAASTAIEMGVPIYGIVAMTGTATDREGRSVPAPGKGVLTSARELPGGGAAVAQLLDVEYRRRQLELRRRQIDEWAKQERLDEASRAGKAFADSDFDKFIESEVSRQYADALDSWGNSFWKRNAHISPLRGALAVWGLGIDDIGVASFHGTSTKANDKNESEIVERQLRHLGRTPGNLVFAVCQKYLTGHPKGPAAMWMLNGMVQSLATGLVPGNRNADNIAAELEQCEYLVYPSRAIQTPGLKAGLLKSFGFGQVGAECLVVHPDYLLATLPHGRLERYRRKVLEREAKSYRYWHNVLASAHTFVQIKTKAPYSGGEEEQFYLNPLARV
ncbi:fatty acid synthase alpha subunit Lsd1 [Coemansia sp. RSA 2050]|nr:fatty acid synthase alpha subunit Lsd1 [Coemansia sp. RSA 2050]